MYKLIFFLFTLVIVLSGCIENKKDSFNSLEEPFNKDIIFSSYDYKTDSIFQIMNDSITIYFITNKIEVPISPVDKLNQLKDILKILYDYDTSSESKIDIECGLRSQSNQIEFLGWFILKEIKNLVSDSLYSELVKEKYYINKLIESQQDFIKNHYDRAIDGGAFRFIKYYQIEIKILQDWQDSLQELYYSFCVPLDSQLLERYSYYPSIPDSHFERAYNHIINDLIPIRPYRESVLASYNYKEDKTTSKKLKSVWLDFMNHREKIQSLLLIENKNIWKNATNRFKRSNLILIKNEFEGLGYCSNDVSKIILSDSCTISELINYSNFSTVWKMNHKD